VLLSIGQIAKKATEEIGHRVEVHQVAYAIAALKVAPKQRTGNARLFDGNQARRIIKRIQATGRFPGKA
jgi:hypothetical protein